MKTVSMVEFRKNAEKILKKARNGETMILTYRRKPVVKLEPIVEEKARKNDPFYSLGAIADLKGKTMTNEEMDSIIYDEKS